ncbi:hypothetical protein [Actinoplanes derwentensis]|uniref:Uncharacterized protein n=1 Tax=Actinoplanes derwentensis TaxID=113562 RepID=A0A1H2A770_9ACTN|nr:hypothetical protein [Actinoplanes derwentensis]GID88487.1 hypothetical protein Ade03nite_74110 [Actinoplanes derwentensis]SDT41734.1 hypothetical protein SAMN04489716_3697 [Actinoplanes derwentensis]
MNDLDRLAVLDPARGREPSAMEWTRSEAFVERVMDGTARVSTSGPAPMARRWAVAGAAAMAAGAVAAIAVPALVPGDAEKAIASWTAMPASRAGEQVMPQARACAANGVGGNSTAEPSDVLLAEQRGDATLLIMRKDDGIVECLMVGDVDRAASMALTDAGGPPPQAEGTINLETMSSYGDGDDQWSNIVGLAGPGVTAVEVRLDSGALLQASVKSGWWAAWWPGPEGGEVDSMTITVHAGDRTTSYRPSELP